MTVRIADRAAGKLQGAADAVQGVAHQTRSGDRDHGLGDREAAAHARWEAGQPPRNQFERDHFAELEARVDAGMRQLEAEGRQASAMEAARAAEAAEAEAGG